MSSLNLQGVLDTAGSAVSAVVSNYEDYLYYINNGYIYLTESPPISPPQIDEDDCEKIGSFITEEYELLRKVFGFLPLLHLNAAEHVCRSWAVAAKAEKQSRGRPYWFVFRRLLPMFGWDCFVEGIYSEPSMCIWFSSRDFKQYHVAKEEHGQRYYLISNIEAITSDLNCALVSVTASGVIGTTTDLKITHEGSALGEQCQGGAACVLLLPVFPGIVIKQFKLSLRDCRRFREGSVSADWVRNIVGGPDKPIRCLLLFCKNRPLAPSLLARHLQERQELKMAIGGVVIDVVELNQKDEHVVGIAFYGDNMSASSIVVNETVTSESDIDNTIKNFREGTVIGSQNIGLMFSCVGRSLDERNPAERDQVESRLFKKHFKNTPLHGCIGNGEIGLDCLPANSDENKPKKSRSKREFAQMLHSYSTVFVHLAFNIQKS